MRKCKILLKIFTKKSQKGVAKNRNIRDNIINNSNSNPEPTKNFKKNQKKSQKGVAKNRKVRHNRE